MVLAEAKIFLLKDKNNNKMEWKAKIPFCLNDFKIQ